MKQGLQLVVMPGESGRVDRWLSEKIPGVSRSRIQALLKSGNITFTQGVPKANMQISVGQSFTVILPAEEPDAPQPQPLFLDILYEDDDLLVLNKPAGQVVHPAPGHNQGTLVNALLWHCEALHGVGEQTRPGIVHRLDKDTSGVMVVAKNEAARLTLVSAFKASHVQRQYTVLTHGVPLPQEGVITTLMGRHPVNRKKMAVVSTGGKQAVTRYSVAGVGGTTARVDCWLETGRTHQIRVHLHSLRHPVLGDKVYGKSALDRKLPVMPVRQMLHACVLGIKHPQTNKFMEFQAPLPADFKEQMQVLGYQDYSTRQNML